MLDEYWSLVLWGVFLLGIIALFLYAFRNKGRY